MQRAAIKDLLHWYGKSKRKPLVLRGARQVGKSTLVRQFARDHGLKLLEINLEKQKLSTLQEDGLNMPQLLQEIEVIGNQRLDEKSLIFFDEIQEQPKLLSALRYFYEDYPTIAVIAAGSLLDFVLGQQTYSVPVGRIEYYFLGPMKFSEFLIALGDTILAESLAKGPHDIASSVHTRLIRRYQEFLYVGGMPEAVDTFAKTSSPLEVRRVQRAIVHTYQDDFIKYSRHSQVDRVRRVFNYVPGHLGQKVKFSEIDREEKSRDLKQALQLLIEARVVMPVYHTNASTLPLRSQSDETVFKLYFLDVGLAHCLQGVEWKSLMNANFELGTKGAMAEQFVAQHLFFKSDGFEIPELYYWLRDKKNQAAEIDFIIVKEEQITPVEVKAATSGKLKSLLIFMNDKKLALAIRLDLRSYRSGDPENSSELVEKSVATAKDPAIFELLSVPLYWVESI